MLVGFLIGCQLLYHHRDLSFDICANSSNWMTVLCVCSFPLMLTLFGGEKEKGGHGVFGNKSARVYGAINIRYVKVHPYCLIDGSFKKKVQVSEKMLVQRWCGKAICMSLLLVLYQTSLSKFPFVKRVMVHTFTSKFMRGKYLAESRRCMLSRCAPSFILLTQLHNSKYLHLFGEFPQLVPSAVCIYLSYFIFLSPLTIFR